MYQRPNMKKITLEGILTALRLRPGRQNEKESALFIGDRLPSYTLSNVYNYEKATATIEQLQANNSKLLLLNFWFTTCTGCMKQWPGLNTLQQQFSDQLQIVLVSSEPDAIVLPFIKNWEKKNGKKMELVTITGDTVLHESFRQLYNPHYAWVAPGGMVLAQTDSSFINAGQIKACLQYISSKCALFE